MKQNRMNKLLLAVLAAALAFLTAFIAAQSGPLDGEALYDDFWTNTDLVAPVMPMEGV